MPAKKSSVICLLPLKLYFARAKPFIDENRRIKNTLGIVYINELRKYFENPPVTNAS